MGSEGLEDLGPRTSYSINFTQWMVKRIIAGSRWMEKIGAMCDTGG